MSIAIKQLEAPAEEFDFELAAGTCEEREEWGDLHEPAFFEVLQEHTRWIPLSYRIRLTLPNGKVVESLTYSIFTYFRTGKRVKALIAANA
jgi:hypothetical protein